MTDEQLALTSTVDLVAEIESRFVSFAYVGIKAGAPGLAGTDCALAMYASGDNFEVLGALGMLQQSIGARMIADMQGISDG